MSIQFDDSGNPLDIVQYIVGDADAETGMESIGTEVVGYLKNEYTGANAAEKVGIAIFQDLPSGRLAIPAFNTVNNYAQEFDLSANANPTLKFQAAFFKPDPVVMGELKAGKFEANITVEMIYL